MLDRNHEDRARWLVAHHETIEQFRISRNLGATINPQCLADSWNQENQRNPGIANKVVERLRLVVSTTIGKKKGLIVFNRHKSGRIPARRHVKAVRAG